jgi:hypothetical protein
VRDAYAVGMNKPARDIRDIQRFLKARQQHDRETGAVLRTVLKTVQDLGETLDIMAREQARQAKRGSGTQPPPSR